MKQDNEIIMHHLKCRPSEVGRYVLLPGDPGRVEAIASYLENAHHVKSNREYTIWSGTLCGETVTVMSTGMGGPSTAIAVEELHQCGADTLIRVGGCGGIDPELIPGTVIIPNGAIRQEGTGCHYVPMEFPAVPNYDVVHALRTAAEKLSRHYAIGIIQSKDSYYGQHSPDSMPVYEELDYKWKAWQRAGALASEMECATLFLVAQVRRMRAGAVLMLCGNPERKKKYGKSASMKDYTDAIETAVEAVKLLIQTDCLERRGAEPQ